MTDEIAETLAPTSVSKRRGLSNQFLCVRKRRDEVQLSSMLAHLLQTHQPAMAAFEGLIGLPSGQDQIVTVEDHDPIHGRTDIRIDCEEYLVVVESKIDAGFQPDQLQRYLALVDIQRFERPGYVVVLQPYDVQQTVEDVHWKTWNGLVAALRKGIVGHVGDHARTAVEDFVTMLEDEMLASVVFEAAEAQSLRQARSAFAWVINELRAMQATLKASGDFTNVTYVDVAKNQNIRFRATGSELDVWILYSIRRAAFAIEAVRPAAVEDHDWESKVSALLTGEWSSAGWRHDHSTVAALVLDPDLLVDQVRPAGDLLREWILDGLAALREQGPL
jgi:hypothetical protein